MKCVRCQTNNNLRERIKAGGRCKYCGHPFVFDPKAGSKFTDIFFSKSLKDISLSSENTLFFTSQQFRYLIEKRLKSKNLTPSERIFGACLECFLIICSLPIIIPISVIFPPIIYILATIIFLIFFNLILQLLWGSQFYKNKPKTRRNFALSLIHI